MTNCRGYANREAGLKDNTGRVTYSYSHFYGNNVAQFPASDAVGGIAGNGNVSSALAPVVRNFNTYPARFSFTVDDVGSSAGTEDYINSLVTVFSSRGLKFNAAVVPSYPVDWTSVKNWFAAGNEIDSHSWSHQYYTTTSSPAGTCTLVACPNAPALSIQYTGPGTAASMSITGSVLTITVTGTPADGRTVNLASSPNSPGSPYTRQELHDYFAGLAYYSVSDPSSPFARPNTKSINLASVSSQDIKSAPYTLLYDQTLLLPDEMSSSKNAIQSNVPGSNATFYVYPDGIEDPSSEVDAISAGYRAARGSLSMKGQDNVTASANSLYSNGVNVQNITSLGAMQIHGWSQPQIDRMVANLVFRASAWGVPYGLFTHYNTRGDQAPDITNAELGMLLDSITAHGGVVMSNTALANAIAAGTNLSNGTRYVQNPAGSAVNLAMATAGSPTIGSGAVTLYPIDINGVDRSISKTWDIGASNYVSQRYGARSGNGQWMIGKASAACGPPNYCAYPGVDIALWPAVPDMGAALKSGLVYYDTSLPSAHASPVARCTDAGIDPASAVANMSKSAGLGGSGDAEQLFNSNSTLLHFNTSGGGHRLTLFNPSTMVCGDPVTGYDITAAKNLTTPGSAASGYNFGSGSFSWTDPAVYFAFGSGNDAPQNGVAKYTINTTTGTFTVQTPYLDFAYGLPLGPLAAAWQPNTSYSTGDYVSYTFSLPDWSVATFAAGDLIVPLANNPLGCAFKLSTAGTRGTEPNPWSTTGSCVTAQTKTEGGGTEVWRNIGNGGTFTFQLTGAGGVSGGSTPDFASGGNPDLLSTVADNGLTWMNTGPMIQPNWRSFAGVSKDSNRFCSAFSSNSYGHGAGSYNVDNADQGTGIYVGCYSFSLNEFILLNTATGIQSTVTCSGGTGYACSGGTQSKLTAGGEAYTAITANCNFPVHNAKGGSTLDYVVVGKQGNYSGTCNGHNLLDWQPFR